MGNGSGEALQFDLLMPPCIAAWTICILAAVVLELGWKIERKIERRTRK